ncbi:P-II family nitrogen regulator [Bacteroidetes bacterium endosymbiont of Geopemphigus sp.]|uniref:P-II family nitrogen regulator n=1 Tax=Bacteroidetes bacterium endosymbiont of Geopemphigus sp. TaxID=2047937 RepID=UPI000CD14531|nr:P-II family nitrogen regulator [Bacteroidetes bacterium endosymbiont of Geopemphigus sp.]
MKKVEAIIRRSKFNEVKDALYAVGIDFFTYWDVTGVGNEKESHLYRGVASSRDIQRRYLSIVVSSSFEKRAIEIIMKAAGTGEIGDGKIFVSDIKEAYRIRTAQKGPDALN